MADINIIIPRSNLHFSTTAPLVSLSVVSPPAAQLVFTTTAPLVSLSNIIVPTAQLTFSTTAPRVEIAPFNNAGVPSTLAGANQSLAPGAFVELFELNLNPIGVDSIYRWSPTSDAGTDIIFDGNTYEYRDLHMEGFEWDGRGSLPEPTLKLTNVNRFAGQIASDNQDLVGAHVTRMRTYQQFLDGEAQADPTAVMPIDVYEVFQKVAQTPIAVEWRLNALIDAAGSLLPKRLCLKNQCTHTYRYWDGADFDYTVATCPYVGADKFETDGTPTAVGADDNCGRDLASCRARFGTEPLPTRAFPGMLRVRI